jgi:hypothetical protein
MDGMSSNKSSLLPVYYLLLTGFVQYVVYRGFAHQQHIIFGKSESVFSLQILQISLDTNFIYEKTTGLNLKKMILIKICNYSRIEMLTFVRI